MSRINSLRKGCLACVLSERRPDVVLSSRHLLARSSDSREVQTREATPRAIKLAVDFS